MPCRGERLLYDHAEIGEAIAAEQTPTEYTNLIRRAPPCKTPNVNARARLASVPVREMIANNFAISGMRSQSLSVCAHKVVIHVRAQIFA